MKLCRLIIHNIASVEDADIDFTSPEMEKSGVFLICGKTGAGKSTILDAICLALYGTTPRMQNSEMGSRSEGEKSMEASPSDPRQLLRRNAAEGFVKLSFIGNDNDDYLATWSVARGRKKTSGKLQKVERSVFCAASQITHTKLAEIRHLIDAVVGLDFQQFCRTTMLAQGDFTKFLNSNDTEKAEILEKITGADIYSRVSAEIYNTTKRKEEKTALMEAEISMISRLSDEELAEQTEQLRYYDDRFKVASEQLVRCSSSIEWLDNFTSVSSRFSLAIASQNKIKEQMHSPEIIEMENMLRRREIAAPGIALLKECGYLKEKIDISCKSIRSHESTFAILSAALDNRKSGLDLLKLQKNEFDTKIENFNRELPLLKNSAEILLRLRNLNDILRNIPIKQAEILEDEKKIKQTEEKRESARKSLREKEEEIGRLNARVREAELNNPDIRLNEINRLIQDNISLKGLLSRLKIIISQSAVYKNDIDSATADISRLKSEIERLKEDEKKSTGLLSIKTTAEQEARRLYEKQKMTIDGWAVDVRSRLLPGDSCPVCGSIIEKSFPAEEEFLQLLLPVREAWEKTVAAAEDEKKRLEDTRNILHTREETLEIHKKSLRQTENRLENLTPLRDELLNKLSLSPDEPLSPEWLEERMLAAANAELKLFADKAAAEELQVNIRKLRAAIAAEEEKGKKSQILLERIDRDFEDIKNSKHIKESLLSEIKRRQLETADSLSALIAGDFYDTDWRLHPDAFAKILTNRCEEFDTLSKGRDNLLALINTEGERIERAQKARLRILTLHPHEPAIPATMHNEPSGDLDDCFTGLEKEISAELRLKEDYSRSLLDKKRQLDEYLRLHGITQEEIGRLSAITEKEVENAGAILRKLAEDLAKAEGALETLREQRDILSQASPFSPGEEADINSMKILKENLEKQIKDLNEKAAGIRQLLLTDEQNKKVFADRLALLDAAKADWRKWSQLNSMLGSADGKKFRKIAQSYVLESLVRGANRYMATLNPRFSLRVEPGTFIISVEDAYMGYASRPGSVISGGESFVVSLALALSLSDMGERLSVDTLFIDEGFGTLSAEYLDRAISTLERLYEKGGRRVGIISHVAELRERIPVQIQVTQKSNLSSSTVTVISKH